MEQLATAGVQQTHKEERAGIFVGAEFGTVACPDLVAAAREAGDAGVDVIAWAFNYEAQASEFNRLGRIPVLKTRMNADLRMAYELKNTGKGKLFVYIFRRAGHRCPPGLKTTLKAEIEAAACSSLAVSRVGSRAIAAPFSRSASRSS